MSGYPHDWAYFKDTSRLISEGASLRDLYDALLTIEDSDGWTDFSPQRIQTLAQWWAQAPSFVPIRLHELFGHADVVHDDAYVLAMIGHLGGRWDQDVRLHLLRHDTELLDDIFWRIFEVEGGGEISLTNVDKFSDRHLNWHETVLLLADEGTISRLRLLRSCLEALNRDFSAYRAGWFSKMFNALAPSAVEAAALQDLLRQCLASSATATISVGAKYLSMIHKADLLDTAEFVEAASPGLSGPKSAALSILRLLESLARDRATTIDEVVTAAVPGLAHPHTDVQRATTMLLKSLGREDVARASRDALAPSVASELLPDATSVGDSTISARTALVGGTDAAAEPVTPWSDDDARERFSALLEFGTNALDFELALAWLAVTENAQSTLAPLAKRARKIAADDGRYWIAQLVLLAVDPTRNFLPQPTYQGTRVVMIKGTEVEEAVGEPVLLPTAEQQTVLPSLVSRIREVASIMKGESPRRHLLATPTDSQGWISADVLLTRFVAERATLPVDLGQALLRVRPSERHRILTATGAESPAVTADLAVEWIASRSAQVRPSGIPEWTWWAPSVIADATVEPSSTQPGIIPTVPAGARSRRVTTSLVAGMLGLVNPSSSLPLVAVAIPLLNSAMSEINHAAGPILTALASHPGAWTAETAQVVALGLAMPDAGLRAQASELLAAVIPARISAEEAAVGFASCQPAIVLSRWTSSLADAATIAPRSVIDLLTRLLPLLERGTRGIGGLVALLLDESLRHRCPVTDPALRAWLGAFSGSSAAARYARALLALDGAV